MSSEGPVSVHRQRSEFYGILDDAVYNPVNHLLLRDLLGRLLTQLDAMALPDRAHRAARTLITAEVWRWWDFVHENAVTSGQGCIAPVVVRPIGGRLSNRWGFADESAYLDTIALSPPGKGKE